VLDHGAQEFHKVGPATKKAQKRSNVFSR